MADTGAKGIREREEGGVCGGGGRMRIRFDEVHYELTHRYEVNIGVKLYPPLQTRQRRNVRLIWRMFLRLSKSH